MKTIVKRGRIATMVALASCIAAFTFSSLSVAKSKSAQESPRPLVTVCHFGMTIKVDRAAVSYHLAHGDYRGVCTTIR